MRKALYTSILVLLALTIYAQEKVTISGKITVKDTGKPPIGIITIAEKGVADYIVMDNVISTNHHTFVEKDGSYRFTINKGGGVVINDGFRRYKSKSIDNLNKSKELDVELETVVNETSYLAYKMFDFEKKTDIHKRIKISGRITFPDGKGMQNVSVGQMDVFTARAPGPIAYTLSNKDGEYSYTVLKGGRISFKGIGYERQIFTATQDTVINVKMKKVNPFKMKN